MPKRVRFDDMDSDFESESGRKLISKLIRYLEQHAEKLEDKNTLYTIEDLRYVLADIIGTLQLILNYIQETPNVVGRLLGSITALSERIHQDGEKHEEDGHYFS